jgi:hypothetical protein
VLTNQCGPQQRQRPVGRALLATVGKDADLRRACQSVSRGRRGYCYLQTAHLERTQKQRVS